MIDKPEKTGSDPEDIGNILKRRRKCEMRREIRDAAFIKQTQAIRAQIELKLDKISALRDILQDKSSLKIRPDDTAKRLETLLFIYDKLLQYGEQLADVQSGAQSMSDDDLERLSLSVIEALAGIDGKSPEDLYIKLDREATEYRDRFAGTSMFTAVMEVLSIEIDKQLRLIEDKLSVIYGEIFINDKPRN